MERTAAMTEAGTILIVDDEPDVLNVLTDIVSAFGYRVIPRPDAESALDVIREEARIDLVITDLRMPGMSGIDLASHVKKALPSVPVILLTAYGSVESYIQTRSRGVFEYINKPVQSKELRRIVQAAISSAEA